VEVATSPAPSVATQSDSDGQAIAAKLGSTLGSGSGVTAGAGEPQASGPTRLAEATDAHVVDSSIATATAAAHPHLRAALARSDIGLDLKIALR
jgi:hypothetical protein